MVSLKDIAKKADVSVSIVSRVINGHAESRRISRKTAEKVKKIADQLNYIPNAGARSIKTGKTNQIGVVIPSSPIYPMNNFVAYETIMGINSQLEINGYLINLVNYSEFSKLGEHKARFFKERFVEGIICIGNFDSSTVKSLKELFPVNLWVDSDIWQQHNCIRRDEFAAGQMAAEVAAGNNYKKIVWLGPDMKCNFHYSISERYAGVADMAGKFGIPITTVETFYAAEKMAELVKHISADTIFITYGAGNAIDLAFEMGERGIRCGIDFGLISCDETVYEKSSWKKLTRIANDRFTMGVQAANMILQVLEKDDHKIPSVKTKCFLHVGTTGLGKRI